MGISDDDANEELESLLVRLGSLPTTHAEITAAGNILMHTILPILPDEKLRFVLYFINVAPVRASKQQWRKYNIDNWVALNSDATYLMEFHTLENLQEGCIAGEELWWCFETFPVEKLTAESCLTKALKGPKIPEISCYGELVRKPEVNIIDTTENRYLITLGQDAKLYLQCTTADGTAAAPEVVNLVAGSQLYELKPRCSADILNYVLPTNWYIPVAEDTLLIVTNLATEPDGIIPTAIPAAELSQQQPQSTSTTTIEGSGSSIARDDPAAGAELEPRAQTPQQTGGTGQTKVPAEQSGGLKAGTFANLNKQIADLAAAGAKSSRHSEEDLKTFVVQAREAIKGLAEWVRHVFDFGDILALVLSIIAILMSTGMLLYMACKQGTGPNRRNSAAEGRFKKWLSRNSKLRKSRNQDLQLVSTKRRSKSTSANTSAPATPATFHIQPEIESPSRRSLSQPNRQYYKSVPTAPPFSTATTPEGSIRITVRNVKEI
jgi:hypothetical protein